MEENTSLFSLSIDPAAREHLSETAKWGRFLAILGFVFLVLLIISGLVTSMTLSRLENTYGTTARGMGGIMGATSAVMYILMAVIYFFPLLYMLRFSTAMQAALRANDQERLNYSFQNLKACFRYVGIVTIIALVFMLIAVVVALAGLAVS